MARGRPPRSWRSLVKNAWQISRDTRGEAEYPWRIPALGRPEMGNELRFLVSKDKKERGTKVKICSEAMYYLQIPPQTFAGGLRAGNEIFLRLPRSCGETICPIVLQVDKINGPTSPWIWLVKEVDLRRLMPGSQRTQTRWNPHKWQISNADFKNAMSETCHYLNHDV